MSKYRHLSKNTMNVIWGGLFIVVLVLFMMPLVQAKAIPSPLQQFKSGIPAEDIECRNNLHLVINSIDGRPACVTAETKVKLVIRGWISLQENISPNVIPLITIPKGISDPIPEVSLEPDVIVVQLGVNNTVSWLNKDTISLTIMADDKSWGRVIDSGKRMQVKFNQTGFYAYRIEPTYASGSVVVMGEDIDSLALEIRLKMAQAILSQEMHTGSPLWGLAIGTPDNVLEISILEDELNRIPNAKKYYENLYKEMIQFDVPIRIEFGPQPSPN